MSNTIRIGLLLLALLFFAGRTDAAEYSVGALGADTNDGLNREASFATIQKASMRWNQATR